MRYRLSHTAKTSETLTGGLARGIRAKLKPLFIAAMEAVLTMSTLTGCAGRFDFDGFPRTSSSVSSRFG